RYATYEGATQANLNERTLPQVKDDIKQNPYFYSQPFYWIEKHELDNRISEKWNQNWLIAFRDVTGAASERTAIFSILPKVAVGNSAPLILLDLKNKPSLATCIFANFCSLIFDFVARQKVGGAHMNFFIVKQ
ncbi:hypothetical protein, partial [Klebsiella pneumoniae]|uniref:hypothetical protein n=1 Tax=Klebsiella pneumoniae TaxID=573 RepID=UPI001C1F7EB8